MNRGPEEADAETVRVGVLLDELDFPGTPRLCLVQAVGVSILVGRVSRLCA